MPIARVQPSAIGASSNSASAVTAAFPANNAAGNLIVLYIASYNNGATKTWTISDTNSNAYVHAGTSAVNGSLQADIYYAANVAGGANTISVTPSGAAYVTIGAMEYSAATSSPLDSTHNNTATSAAMTTGSIPVNQGGDLVVGVFSWSTGSSNWITSIFSGIFAVTSATAAPANASSEQMAVVNDISNVSEALTAAMQASSAYAAAGASFKAVSSGGGGMLLF